MRLLVTGGREFSSPTLLSGDPNPRYQVEKDILWLEMGTLMARRGGLMVVGHGDAPGVDRSAGDWAERMGLEVQKYPILTGEDGFMRNVRMLHEFRPDQVAVFPGGRGTAHMAETATRAGVPIVFLPEREPRLI